MQRLQTAVAACCNDPSIRVVLDINPDHWENLAYINATLPGEFLAHDRIKELFRQRNVKYFMVDEISEAFELQKMIMATAYGAQSVEMAAFIKAHENKLMYIKPYHKQ